jgi:inhibitor of cysteine peptidase
LSGWNLSELARVAALLGAILLLHASGAVAAETGKAQAKAQAKVDAMQSLTEADNERTVDLRVGESVRLTLPENATTGYRWTVDHFDRGVVEPAGSEPHYAGGAVGAAGQVTFDFKAKQAGSGEVALKYWRHFEGEGSVVKRFRFRLNAKL